MNNPDIRITVDGRDLTLAYPLAPEHHELLHDLHDSGDLHGVIECRMHDDDYRLADLRDTDGRVRGAWLYLRRHAHEPDRLLLCHWPGGRVTGSHTVPSRMTPEHRAGQEYIARRGEDVGYRAEIEKSITPGTRSDVVVTGDVVMAAEIQVSGIRHSKVLSRARKATDAGACSTWFSEAPDPKWRWRVPTVTTNRIRSMVARSWQGFGPRALEWEHCGPSSRTPCPNGPNTCGQWHPIWRPIRDITVDWIVERVPAGELVRLDTGTKQGTTLVTPRDRDAWLQHQAVVPAQRKPPQRPQRPRHAAYDPAKLRRRITAASERQSPPEQPPPPAAVTRLPRRLDALGHAWPLTGRACATCGWPLIPTQPGQQRHPECEGSN